MNKTLLWNNIDLKQKELTSCDDLSVAVPLNLERRVSHRLNFGLEVGLLALVDLEVLERGHEHRGSVLDAALFLHAAVLLLLLLHVLQIDNLWLRLRPREMYDTKG